MVDDADQHLLARGSDATSPALGRREPERVLEQVDERALDLRASTRTGGSFGRAITIDAVRVARARRAPARRARPTGQSSALGAPRRPAAARGRAGRRRGASAVLCLESDRLEQLGPVASVELQLVAAKRVERCSIAGQRRAKVVGDGPEDGRLDRCRCGGAPRPRPLLARRRSRSLATASSEASAGRKPPPHRRGRLLALVRVERADHAPVDRERVRRLARGRRARVAELDPRQQTPSTSAAPRAMRLELLVEHPARRSSVATSARSAASRSRCSASAARRERGRRAAHHDRR